MTETSEIHRIYPVILSGGTGSRLWPVSRQQYPKQLHRLTSEQSLLQQTVSRVSGPEFEPPIVICNEDHRFIIDEQLRELGITAAEIILEPCGRNTTAAAVVATLAVAKLRPDGLVLLLPADHLVGNLDAFQEMINSAIAAATKGFLATFSITPTGPETSYGYIQRGTALTGAEGCYKVTKFVEKPNLQRANEYLAAGKFGWNSGMFLWSVDTFLAEARRLKPDLVANCQIAYEKATLDLNFLRLDKVAFTEVEAISVDYAVFEQTDKAVCVPVDLDWNDVGSWSALWQVSAKDAKYNVTSSNTIMKDTSSSYLRSDGPLVATVGLENMIVVATDDAVLVGPMERAQEVGDLAKQIEASGRNEHLHHKKIYRPWGHYQTLDVGDRFQVKQLFVKPGEKLSLQMHHHRAEHWVVVSGTAMVRVGDKEVILSENQSTYIPLGETHSLANPGKTPLQIIEVQSGSYLGEDDIVRFEDRYGRIETEPQDS